jgi:hypothetical protein
MERLPLNAALNAAQPLEWWYRFESHNVSAGVDECGDPIRTETPIVEVGVTRFAVVKHTPKGVRLDSGRLVMRNSRKRYACPTIEEALESFKARKRAQIRILSRQVKAAELALRQAKALQFNKWYFPFPS